MLVPLVSPSSSMASSAKITEDSSADSVRHPGAVKVRPQLLTPSDLPFISKVVDEADVDDIEQSLPWAYRYHDWTLLYSLQSHGSSLETFMYPVDFMDPVDFENPCNMNLWYCKTCEPH